MGSEIDGMDEDMNLTRLFGAIEAGQTALALELIAVSGLGNPADGILQHAASHGHAAVLPALMELVDPWSCVDDEHQWTASFHAAKNGEAQCLRLLLPFTDVHHKDFNGIGVYERAAELGDQCMKVLDELGEFPVNERLGALRAACSNSNIQGVEHLLGQKDLVKALIDSRGLEGDYAETLMDAAHVGSIGSLELLKPLIDQESFAKSGILAMGAAAGGNEPKSLAWLMKQGVDPKDANQDGLTPLMRASMDNSLECISMMIPVSNIEAVDKHGYSALKYAEANKKHGAVKLLEAAILAKFEERELGAFIAAPAQRKSMARSL